MPIEIMVRYLKILNKKIKGKELTESEQSFLEACERKSDGGIIFTDSATEKEFMDAVEANMKIEPEIKVIGYRFGPKHNIGDNHYVFVRGVMSINGHGAYHDVKVPYDPPLNKKEKQRIMKLLQELGSMEQWAKKFINREENAGIEKVDEGSFEEEFIKNRESYGWETIDE